MGKLGQTLSQYWNTIQGTLFPQLEEELDPLTEKQMQLVSVLEIIRIERFIPDRGGFEGRPPHTRKAIARSFVAKMVYNIDTTRALWERLQVDKNLRRLCGWESLHQIPSESTFSRAFAEFAETSLPKRVHEELIKKVYEESEAIVLHISRDSTAIEAREKHVKKEEKPRQARQNKVKRGRPRK